MNPNTHFYLYAKDWYKRSENKMNDLKVLQANYSGTDITYIQENDVLDHLTSLAWYEINKSGNPQFFFTEFSYRVTRDGLVGACLFLLQMAETGDSDKYPKLGRPDDKILPLNCTQEDVDQFIWHE
jgi:hypothetical protein